MSPSGLFVESTQLRLLKALHRWESLPDLDTPLLTPAECESLLAHDPSFGSWVYVNTAGQFSDSNSRNIWLCRNLFGLLQQLPDELAPGLRQATHQTLQNKLLRQNFTAEIADAKREMLYHLAYGLSHEINNPLANISTRAQLLQSTLRSPKEQQILSSIVDQANRAFEMLGDLMQCAKTPKLSSEWFDAGQRLREVVDGFTRQKKHFNVEWIIHASDQQLIYSDPSLVHEILEIIIQNSLDAIGEQGTITAELRCDASQYLFLISDTGSGLTTESRRHALDPFFSGRDAGRGIGLGLCKANHFAHVLGGKLNITSHPNAGCLVTFSLPSQANT
jgi:signal transduction histidine kinase